MRTIAGTTRIHMELEEKIARFKDVKVCVVFQSGFTANASTSCCRRTDAIATALFSESRAEALVEPVTKAASVQTGSGVRLWRC